MSLGGVLVETRIRLADVAGIMNQVLQAVTGSGRPSTQHEQASAGMVDAAHGLLAEANGISALVGELANALGVDLHGQAQVTGTVLKNPRLPRGTGF